LILNRLNGSSVSPINIVMNPHAIVRWWCQILSLNRRLNLRDGFSLFLDIIFSNSATFR
jgi:hypothetical protein